MSLAKMSKEEANYRNGRADYKCKLCTMFRPLPSAVGANTCTVVRGIIAAGAVCDYFEPK